MRFAPLVSASLLAAAMSLPFAAAAQANIAISVDKSTQRMSVTVDGQQRYVWPVSTGRAGYNTPSGNFRLNRMDADHFSQEWDNAPMPHSMFFDLHGHAIHGFFDVKHLGMAVSHGCVRLSPDHAATLFGLVKAEGMANTSVSISGHIPGAGDVPVAAAHLPQNETVYNARGYSLPPDNAQPMPLAPQYQQRAYQQQPPQYSYQQQPQYQGQQAPQYQGQQDQDQQYAQQRRSLFPPQPQPYGQPAYGQPYDNGQSNYGGQGYYAQPGYGAPVYRQY
ncbi:MAG: L,D-transpeptidase [Xanthobacteraceae bacterium]